MNKDIDIIHVLDKRVCLRQPADGFRTSLDSVMLAAACPAKKRQSILDLGCGVGSAGLCVLTRVPDTTLTGIDIQKDHIALAQENAVLNNVKPRTTFIHDDIRTAKLENADHIICNPPYLDAGAHTPSPHEAKAAAMGHLDEDIALEDWIACAFDHIKGRGSLTIIHAAGQTDRIIQALGKRFGATEIIPLWPRQNTPAKRVIVRTWKHKKSPAAIHPGLILHEANGNYTPDADAVLRDAKALF